MNGIFLYLLRENLSKVDLIIIEASWVENSMSVKVCGHICPYKEGEVQDRTQEDALCVREYQQQKRRSQEKGTCDQEECCIAAE